MPGSPNPNPDLKEFSSESDHQESLEDPAVMFNMLFQLSMAMAKMQNKNELVHFDVRHDNVQVIP